MNEIIKERLAIIQSGTIPHGYKKTKAGIMPEDWDGNVRAKDVFRNHTDKKHNGDLEILAATQENGIVPRSQIGIDIQCSEDGVKGYKKVSKGDFVISLRSFQGGIEYSEYDGIVSPAYIVLQPVREISDGYYRNYFKTASFIQRLNGAVYGIRDGKQIGYQDFGDMYIHCPPVDEQKKIAEVLSCCDRIIELKQQLIVELQRLKNGFLQAMFPAKGHNKPDIRFKGFTEAWEQRKLGEVAEFNPKADLPESFEYVDLESVVGTEMIAHRTETKTTAPSRAQRLAQIGDLFYQTVRPYQRNNYFFEKTDNTYVFSTGYAQMRPHIDGYFLLSFLQTDLLVKAVLDRCTGTSYPAINANDLAEMVVRIPMSKQEQEAIGTYFSNLDNLITLHQRELEETKKKKRGLAKLLLTGSVRVPT